MSKQISKCHYCGNPLIEGDLFCINCGNKVNEVSLINVEKENLVKDEKVCKYCGTLLAEDDMFCFSCGNKIEDCSDSVNKEESIIEESIIEENIIKENAIKENNNKSEKNIGTSKLKINMNNTSPVNKDMEEESDKYFKKPTL